MSSSGASVEDPGRAAEVSNRGWSRLLFRTFRDPEIEALYREYHDTARRTDVQYMLTCALACGAVGLGHEAPVGFRATHIAVIGVLTGLQALLLAVTTLQWPGAACWKALPYITWLLFVATIAAHVELAHLSGPTEALEWYILLILLVYLCLPVRLRWCVVMSVLTAATYVTTNLVFASDRVHLRERVAASGVLLLGAVALGTTAYLFTDLRQRRTYLETRKVIEVKTSIEEQSRTRERLLLSVLPRHVADTMRQDWGRIDVGQFKKIYMKRHENVSILFADIVGFTAISSSYSAYDLVHMLNELFASFDRLADKYDQLRIKILGDCYYCISGCPEETEDHAVQSVYMGLSMVTAIKSVRESTKSTVDMRVGIHTGAVLAGVMGQRQWQFDVYSKDVELANKMESSGKPGRVHVSNKTVEKLADQFHIERAFAEKREPYLRGAGLVTYFIVKPKRSSSLGGKEGGTDAHQEADQRGSANAGNGEGAAIISNGRDPEGNVYQSKVKPEQPQTTQGSNSVRDLRPHVRWFTLFFTDPEIEKEYRANREPTFGLSAVCLPIVLSFNAISQGIITPSTINTVTTLFGGVLLLLLMTLFILPSHWMRRMPGWLASVSAVIQSSNTRTQTWVVGMNLLLTACNLADMIMCPLNSRPFMFPFTSSSTSTTNKTLSTSRAAEPSSPLPCSTAASALPPHLSCTYPSYFTFFCVLILCTYPVQIELRHVTKLPLLLLATALHAWVNIAVLEDVLDCVSTNVYSYDGILPEKYDLCLALCVTCVVVIVLNVQTEVSSRAAFLWKREMAQQQAQAASLQEKNESLVQNLLPPHVTQHFLKRDVTTSQHEELYAQSFDEVGVLFASMPNFGDFYSEESVNNQGLECLRFLNEVISDYDALLDSPRFRGISKIKTIASSYMAASGLVTIQDKSEPDIVRWQHLSVLVEFAMQLRTTLSNINAESFNHFIFQMGINHGPVTAGVIGARKPHYDIWGNTVNVASRMESTGQAGQIQVTGKTKEILELFGYQFEQRGIMLIKGKGQLLTYFLTGRRSPPEDTRRESAHSGGTRDSAVVDTTCGARTDLTEGGQETNRNANNKGTRV